MGVRLSFFNNPIKIPNGRLWHTQHVTVTVVILTSAIITTSIINTTRRSGNRVRKIAKNIHGGAATISPSAAAFDLL